MRASRGLKWENEMYKLKMSIAANICHKRIRLQHGAAANENIRNLHI